MVSHSFTDSKEWPGGLLQVNLVNVLRALDLETHAWHPGIYLNHKKLCFMRKKLTKGSNLALGSKNQYSTPYRIHLNGFAVKYVKKKKTTTTNKQKKRYQGNSVASCPAKRVQETIHMSVGDIGKPTACRLTCNVRYILRRIFYPQQVSQLLCILIVDAFLCGICVFLIFFLAQPETHHWMTPCLFFLHPSYIILKVPRAAIAHQQLPSAAALCQIHHRLRCVNS